MNRHSNNHAFVTRSILIDNVLFDVVNDYVDHALYTIRKHKGFIESMKIMLSDDSHCKLELELEVPSKRWAMLEDDLKYRRVRESAWEYINDIKCIVE